MKDRRPVSRRGVLAALAGGAAGFLAKGFAGHAALAAPGQAVVQGQNNDAGSSETILRSDPSGDKATLAVLNETGGLAGSNRPDGIRGFSVGPQGGAGVQGFGGPASFSQAPFAGIGVRGRGTAVGVVGDASSTSGGRTGVAGFAGVGSSAQDVGVVGVRGRAEGHIAFGVLGESDGFSARGVTGLSGYSIQDLDSDPGPGGTAVYGLGTFIGVAGEARPSSPSGQAIGVHGSGDSDQGIGVQGVGAVGVLGETGSDAGVHGVVNRADEDGPTDGAGVRAEARGIATRALEVLGDAHLTGAGSVTVPTGSTFIDFPLVTRPGAVVLALVQLDAGGDAAVKSAAPREGRTIIRFRLTAPAPRDLRVGYLVVYPAT